MIFKIFGNRGAGSATASVNYLVGKNHDRAGASVLKGNIEVTRQLAESLDFKNRYTVGVLSFEETDLPEQTKAEIMASFESTVFAGLEQDQYSIAWVEHKDKDRLELNFFIANVELTTGKRLQPYYDRADRGLIKAWKDTINHDYQLSDPNDPQKTLDLKPNQSLPRNKNDFRQLIHDTIKQEVLAGCIKNRDEVIAFMQARGLEVARTTKTAVSIKDPDGGQNIRFKGEYYEQNFRVNESYTATQDRASRDYRTEQRERISSIRAELESRVTAKREYNQARYPNPTQAGFEYHQLPTQTNDYASDYGRYGAWNDDLHRSFNQQGNGFTGTDNTATTATGGTNTAYNARTSPTSHEKDKIGGKVYEPVFEALQRAYERFRTQDDRTGELSQRAKRTHRAIDERKSSLQSTVGAIKQEIGRIGEQQHDFGARFSQIDREIKQRKQATGEREREINQFVAEQQRELDQSRDKGFGR